MIFLSPVVNESATSYVIALASLTFCESCSSHWSFSLFRPARTPEPGSSPTSTDVDHSWQTVYSVLVDLYRISLASVCPYFRTVIARLFHPLVDRHDFSIHYMARRLSTRSSSKSIFRKSQDLLPNVNHVHNAGDELFKILRRICASIRKAFSSVGQRCFRIDEWQHSC